MKLLVTGARGFVGRRLCEWLAAHGHEGFGTGREPPHDLPTGWRGATRRSVLEPVEAPQAALADVMAVVHLEVKQHVPRPTRADIDDFTAVNVGGTRAWLDWASRRGVGRFVFLSSIKAVAAEDGPMTEAGPPELTTPYGRSKAEAEAAVREWAAADSSRSAVILRPAPVYGPGNEANLAAFVQQILASKPCLIGRGETRKSIVALDNLCAAIEFATARTASGGEVFNVSDRETPSLEELAAMIAELAGAPPPKRIPAWLATLAAPVGDAIEATTGREFPLTTARLRAIRETTVFPCEKLVAAGFVHPQTTREGLTEMIAWAKSQRA
ncbi:MAG: NAD-dependent epimerase/dehydratase family protein [Planctomycetia bacterium]|nr:NAD-dependent epimerase/dehydratase family protein [Planctomycetia bacterium]